MQRHDGDVLPCSPCCSSRGRLHTLSGSEAATTGASPCARQMRLTRLSPPRRRAERCRVFRGPPTATGAVFCPATGARSLAVAMATAGAAASTLCGTLPRGHWMPDALNGHGVGATHEVRGQMNSSIFTPRNRYRVGRVSHALMLSASSGLAGMTTRGDARLFPCPQRSCAVRQVGTAARRRPVGPPIAALAPRDLRSRAGAGRPRPCAPPFVGSLGECACAYVCAHA